MGRGQLLDAIEDEVQSGGRIIDWHACEVFPRSWVDLVVVLRTDGTVLFDRLVGRYVWFLCGCATEGCMMRLA